MSGLAIILAIAGLDVGFLLGALYGVWAERNRAELADFERRKERIGVAMRASHASGRYIESYHDPEEFIERSAALHEDLN